MNTLANIITAIRQWVNIKLENVSYVIASHINTLASKVATLESSNTTLGAAIETLQTGKQDKLTAGANITLDAQGNIAVKGYEHDSEINSFLHGKGLIALNENEVAVGQFNKSNRIIQDLAAINNVEYVDLGLPSGNLWAKYNLGASVEYGDGDWYCFAELTARQSYLVDENGHRYYDSIAQQYTKYVTQEQAEFVNVQFYDNKIVLDIEDDAARNVLNGKWQIPTIEDFEELLKFTTLETCTPANQNRVCMKLTSTVNGNILWIPLSGRCSNIPGVNDINTIVILMSSNILSDNSYGRNRTFVIKNYQSKNTGTISKSHYYIRHKIRPILRKGVTATIYSNGIGSSENDRKNAVEIMSNGDVFVNGIGGYDGTNPYESEVKSTQGTLSHIYSQLQ